MVKSLINHVLAVTNCYKLGLAEDRFQQSVQVKKIRGFLRDLLT